MYFYRSLPCTWHFLVVILTILFNPGGVQSAEEDLGLQMGLRDDAGGRTGESQQIVGRCCGIALWLFLRNIVLLYQVLRLHMENEIFFL